jgi:hypothetical protein
MTDLTEKELARLARGRKAKDVLSSEMIAEALDFLTDRACAEWRGSASANYDAREEAFRQVAAIDALKAQLKVWADDAEGLALKQEREASKAQRLPRFGRA